MRSQSGHASVTVVITNYNGESSLDRCIQSLLASRYPIDEILLVDNGSSDRSLEVARPYEPDVRIIALGYNAGPSVARNVGLQAARNDLVFLLDEDGFVLPDTLEYLVEAHCADPTCVAIAHPRIVFDADPTCIQYDGAAVHYLGVAMQFNRNATLGTVADDDRDVHVVGGNVLVNRCNIIEAGAYDEDFFWGFEDADFALRVVLTGKRCVQVSRALVLHGCGTPGLSMRQGQQYSSARAFHGTKNRLYFIFKVYTWHTLLLIAPALLIYDMLIFAFMLKSHNVGAWLKGWRTFIAHWPQLMQKRRQLQRARQLRDRDFLKSGPLTYAVGTVKGGLMHTLVGLLVMFFDGYWAIISPFI